MEATKIYIVSDRKTPRLVYIFNLILRDLLGLYPEFVSEINQIPDKNAAILCYGAKVENGEFFIASDELLYERGIKEIPISMGVFQGKPCFFETFNKKSVFSFDLFAASFYLVSRYEEYLPFIKDKYGRFEPTQSLAFRKGFLDKPLVNFWANELGKKLLEHYPHLKMKFPEFRFRPTIDIDSAFAYREKGFWRQIGGFVKNLRDRNFNEFVERFKVLAGKIKDPFDSFDFIFDFHRSMGLKPVFFVLFAEYGTNDKNISTQNLKFQRLIRRLHDYGDVGIHPSFMSNKQPQKVGKEIEGLRHILHQEVIQSRQHFLMLTLPETYNRLIDHGINEDYTMGFASQPGFRASIASPFYFYNLEYELVTTLRIYPFAYMEGTLKDYLDKSPEEALQTIKNLIDQVKEVNGTFISLWHNESLGGQHRWKGWPEVYIETVRYAMEYDSDKLAIKQLETKQ